MPLDDRVTLTTPEGVTLELVIAGLGSRFIARLLDTLIQGAVIFALAVGAVGSAGGIGHPSGYVVAFVAAAVFGILFAYDVAFEVLNGGRTPGKAAAGIRVVGPDGEPIGFLASAIRNIVRLVDFLPGAYLAGAIAIVATRRDQRLGDVAAGTIVAREKFPGVTSTSVAPITVQPDAVATWDVSALDIDDLRVVRQFLDRRLALPWPVRAYFASAIIAQVVPRVAGVPLDAHPEYVLEGIVVAKQGRPAPAATALG